MLTGPAAPSSPSVLGTARAGSAPSGDVTRQGLQFDYKISLAENFWLVAGEINDGGW